MIFWVLAALQAVAPILAAWRRLPRLFVGLLLYALLDGLLVEALHRYLFNAVEHPVRTAIALHGPPALAAYHLETAVVLGWPALLAAAAWRVFAEQTASAKPRENYSKVMHVRDIAGLSRRARDLIFGAWLIAAGGLAACYPLPRGWTLPVLHAAEIFFVVAALAAITVGWRRRTIATPEGQAVGLLVVVELVVCVLGAWAWGAKVFDRETWDELARVPYGLGWLVLVVLLARGATSRPSTSSSTSKSREPMF